jgi:quinol monooxygenase YgiN
MIIVMGYIHLAPSDVAEFVADVQAITPETRAEKGCLFYMAALDDAPTGRMLIAERWQDQESLTAHIETQATAAFVAKWMGRMKSEVLKYDASNERAIVD